MPTPAEAQPERSPATGRDSPSREHTQHHGRELRLTEVETLRAMAHPLRIRIMGSLRVDGPATSATLARRLGTDSGQTSHHLRLLARYGFVAEAPELGKGPRGRERWWKAASDSTFWSDDLDGLGPGGAEAIGAFERSAYRAWDSLVDTYREQADRGEWSPAWREAAGAGDMVVRLTPERLTALRDEISAVVERHNLKDQPAHDAGTHHAETGAGETGASETDDAETVVVILQAYPRRVPR